MAQEVSIVKNEDNTYKVVVTENVPTTQEQVFGTLDEAVNYVKQVEQQAEQPQG